MFYIKVEEDQVNVFPYSINQLRKDNPEVSFPTKPSLQLLAEFGVYPVTDSPFVSFDNKTHKLERNFFLVEGVWTQAWVKVPLAQELAEQNIRNHRDNLLFETDWVVAKAYEQGTQVPTTWADYRQALRDITLQAGFPYEVVWPNKPE